VGVLEGSNVKSASSLASVNRDATSGSNSSLFHR